MEEEEEEEEVAAPVVMSRVDEKQNVDEQKLDEDLSVVFFEQPVSDQSRYFRRLHLSSNYRV